MKRIGIEKALFRLKEAKEALDILKEVENGLNVPQFRKTWSQYLNATHSVPEILIRTAKGHEQEFQWLSSVSKNLSRRDPLLRYMKGAREEEFHGIREVATPHAEGANPSTKYVGYVENAGEIVFRNSDGTETRTVSGAIELQGEISSFKFFYKLQEFENKKFNQHYAIPKTHLGRELISQKPSYFAGKTLWYYQQIYNMCVNSAKGEKLPQWQSIHQLPQMKFPFENEYLGLSPES